MTTPNPRRKVKAHQSIEVMDCMTNDGQPRGQPTWTLPRTAAAYDAMVEQMQKATCRQVYGAFWREYYNQGRSISTCRAALRAIGITRPREAAKQQEDKR